MTPKKFALIAAALYGFLFLAAVYAAIITPGKLSGVWTIIVTYPTSSILFNLFRNHGLGDAFSIGLVILSAVINAGILFTIAYYLGTSLCWISSRRFRP